MGAALKEANFSLAGVYYSAGDNIKYQVATRHPLLHIRPDKKAHSLAHKSAQR